MSDSSDSAPLAVATKYNELLSIISISATNNQRENALAFAYFFFRSNVRFCQVFSFLFFAFQLVPTSLIMPESENMETKPSWLKIGATTIGIIILILLVNLALVLYLFGYWYIFD